MKQFWMALALFFIDASNLWATQWPDFPVVYATGTATKEIPPDLAILTFNVTAYDEKSEYALSIALKQSQEIIRYYQELGLDKENLEAYDFDKNIVREDKDYTEMKILGYEVKQKFSIKLPTLDHYTELMEKLLTISNVSDIDTKFDVKQRKEIETTLVSEACANAQQNAENMAHGLGAALDSPQAISESGFHGLDEVVGLDRLDSNTDVFFKKSQYLKENSATMTFIPSKIKIQKRVNVIYRISVN